MRNWEEEHGKDYEVPGLIDYMVDREILVDSSWHNDGAPRFHIVDPKDESRGVTLWVDHPVASQREAGPGGGRFHVSDGEFMSDSEDEFETDDLEKAILTLLRYGNKYMSKDRKVNYPGMVKEWMKQVGR